MTKKQREQVVELLRCAADLDSLGRAHQYIRGNPVTVRGAGFKTWSIAVDARTSAHVENMTLTYAESCLEAAARVEEGSWP